MQEFERDYKKHHHEIYVFLYGLTQSEQEAQELLQETFLAFLQQIRKEEMPPLKKRRWLYKVARNKAINVIRRNVHREKVETVEMSTQETPEQKAVAQERLLQIRGLMARLTERESQILQLYCSGLNYEEMAEVLEVERSSIGKLLGRAKKSFKRLYEANTNLSYRSNNNITPFTES